MIPILELKTQYAQIRQEIEEAVHRVLESTHYILGPEGKALEEEFAEWNGARFGVGVGSGTDALQLALRALGIGEGDEVICPPFTFIATAGAIALTGATPVFAEVEPQTYALDPAAVEARITPRTRAIVVVHLFGHPADMDALLEIARKHDLKVVEDCAQATGAECPGGRKVGTMGQLGCFSFFPSKNLGGLGDGGMVLTSDPELNETLLMLRGHGSKVKYYHDILGTNSRLDEIQAAALRVKLKYLERWNQARQGVAEGYRRRLRGADLGLPQEKPGYTHVYHQFTVQTRHRDQMKAHLEDRGVGAFVYYPLSLHLQRAFKDLGHAPGDFPVSEKLQQEVLSLPMFPELTESQLDEIAGAVKEFLDVSVAKAG